MFPGVVGFCLLLCLLYYAYTQCSKGEDSEKLVKEHGTELEEMPYPGSETTEVEVTPDVPVADPDSVTVTLAGAVPNNAPTAEVTITEDPEDIVIQEDMEAKVKKAKAAAEAELAEAKAAAEAELAEAQVAKEDDVSDPFDVFEAEEK